VNDAAVGIIIPATGCVPVEPEGIAVLMAVGIVVPPVEGIIAVLTAVLMAAGIVVLIAVGAIVAAGAAEVPPVFGMPLVATGVMDCTPADALLQPVITRARSINTLNPTHKFDFLLYIIFSFNQ